MRHARTVGVSASSDPGLWLFSVQVARVTTLRVPIYRLARFRRIREAVRRNGRLLRAFREADQGLR